VTHMAPELLASGHLRQASDVYSFGIMGGWAGWVLPLRASMSANESYTNAAMVSAMLNGNAPSHCASGCPSDSRPSASS
jgi:hypothetical protein